MKIGSSLQFSIPDKCPNNCPYLQSTFYQGDYCSRCPIFNCTRDNTNVSLIEECDYRDDWAKDWEEFFNDLE